MSFTGKYIPINLKEAAKYFYIAADLNHSDEMYNNERMLYKGKGIHVEKNAVHYFKMAVDNQNV